MTKRKRRKPAKVATLGRLVTMNVAVPPILKQWAREQVEAGHYTSASEVVRDALRQLRRRGPILPETPEMTG